MLLCVLLGGNISMLDMVIAAAHWHHKTPYKGSTPYGKPFNGSDASYDAIFDTTVNCQETYDQSA